MQPMTLRIGPQFKYALVSPDGEVARIAGNIDPMVSTKDGWRWLPFAVVAKECGQDQVREPDTLTVYKDRVVREQIVRDLTEREITERTAAMRADLVESLTSTKFAPLLRAILSEVRGAPVSDEDWKAFIEGVV
jgi:hypothetical protein